MTFLSLGFSFEDLLNPLKLRELDQAFCERLKDIDEDLVACLRLARSQGLSSLEESALILDLAPFVEDFLGQLFSIEDEISTLQNQTYALAPLYRCKRNFVQRVAAKAYTRKEALSFDEPGLQKSFSEMMGIPYSDLAFARHVLETKDEAFLDLAKKFAAWNIYQPVPSILFRLPRKIIPGGLLPVQQKTLSEEHALDQAHYCILCHKQEKDSCSKASNGCPLKQKISEMNTLRVQGNVLGALATIMIDNPMVATTGHRICNDCSKGCIFQKQEAVNIPSVETQTLESVLDLPWGVEIYSLLSRWNPLNFKNPYPKAPTGYKVLVAGMGPAGFTLAHYLMNEGHEAVGIDGLKIDPIDPNHLTHPIRSWNSLKI